MDKLRLNKTPVRTSKNYMINDIELERIVFNQNKKFENIDYQDFDFENILVSTATSDINLLYGIGEELEKGVKDNANLKMRIELKGNTYKDNIINLIFNEENYQLIDDIEIIVDENLSGKITIRFVTNYIDSSNAKAFNSLHNGVIRVCSKLNSNLKLTVINLTDFRTTNIMSMENQLAENAKLEYNIVDFGGDSSVTNYYCNLKGDNSENELNTIYIGTGKQLLDMNYIAETRGNKTKMNIDVQGAIKDNARKHFKGTIDFKRGCKKSEGSENEFCMLLSDEAKSISLPMLLCDEEDVIGNHATAAGKVNNKELFYLMSRGLTEKEAKILLVKARFHNVIDNITNEELKNEILAELDNRLL